MKFALAIFLVTAVSSVARGDASADAKAHYERATAHFAVGEFAKAADEYQEAYKLKPDPALLYNAAQSYRLSGNNDRALILYRNYVQLYPNEPNVDDVRNQIAKLKDAIAAQDKAKTNPPTSTVEVKPASTPVAAQPTKREEYHRPIYKKWWLWTIVGGVVVAGVVTGAVLATTSRGSWSQLPDVGPGASHALVQW
jgi:tetratricopeptide (TPR) repeat protein